MLHYTSSIILFGTTDNYNTEQTERLHIDFTKNAYRSTNRKNEYTQMTLWLERRERIQRHAAHITRQQLGGQSEAHTVTPSLGPPHIHHGYLKMPRNPTLKSVSFQMIVCDYGASSFQDALADFIARVNHPGVSAATLRNRAHNTLIPFYSVRIYHKFKYTASDSLEPSEVVDSVHVHPAQPGLRGNRHGRIIPARFDTVLVSEGQYTTHPNKGKPSRINEDLTDCYTQVTR
jgi:hypothetical protein